VSLFRGWVVLAALFCAGGCAVCMDGGPTIALSRRTLAAYNRALAPDGPPLSVYKSSCGVATIDLFREIANPELGSGGKNRTPDLQVMSLTSCRCSTPLESFVAHQHEAVKPFTAHPTPGILRGQANGGLS
jgi:hypothetical protein